MSLWTEADEHDFQNKLKGTTMTTKTKEILKALIKALEKMQKDLDKRKSANK